MAKTIDFYKRGKLVVSFEEDQLIKDGVKRIVPGVRGWLPQLFNTKTGKRIIYDRMEVTQ